MVWSPCRPRDSQEYSPTPQLESIDPSEFSLLYGPGLTSIHDYWKNHRFDQTDLCEQSDDSLNNCNNPLDSLWSLFQELIVSTSGICHLQKVGFISFKPYRKFSARISRNESPQSTLTELSRYFWPCNVWNFTQIDQCNMLPANFLSSWCTNVTSHNCRIHAQSHFSQLQNTCPISLFTVAGYMPNLLHRGLVRGTIQLPFVLPLSFHFFFH